MPELPEVETVCRGLRKALLGDSIAKVTVLRNDSIGSPLPREFAKLLLGHSFVDVRRRGKYILVDLDNGAGLVCHLRMSGRFLVVPANHAQSKFLRVYLTLKSGRELHFEDMRVFGRLWYVPSGEEFETIVPGLQKLGVEPLPVLTAAHLESVFKNRKQSVKSALLDQTLVAGVGNIYADESLFRAGIHPASAAGALKVAQLARLAETIVQVLDNAITLGGSTLSDYRTVEGMNGNYQHQAWVYGRTGEKCRTCGKKIERMKIGGRSSHFCPTCQTRTGGTPKTVQAAKGKGSGKPVSSPSAKGAKAAKMTKTDKVAAIKIAKTVTTTKSVKRPKRSASRRKP
jgi:formamidopyrimidine-DNA glycosylase